MNGLSDFDNICVGNKAMKQTVIIFWVRKKHQMF